ncbi:MAG TPA: three-Cys-motif partner protein TcmP, partial [Lacipirellulaceae bacterium]|nr:three-Cys-motif partner protein TcmP [Lacipirellulaceae bacterium]
RDTHKAVGRLLNIRCVFVEKDRQAYGRLKAFADSVKDAEIKTIPGEFENAIDEIIKFVNEDRETFPFALIDPTGPSGFAMERIAPLLNLRPGEVLINFMLEFIRRFIEQRDLRKSFEELFGTADLDEFFSALSRVDGVDRDDLITEKYCSCLSASGAYPHVLRASVFHPDQDRLYFQLIYATRNIKGVEVFKRTEAKAMKSQELQRAHVEARRRQKGGQRSFLNPDEMPESRFYESLRLRYANQARASVISTINRDHQTPYDRLWLCALSYPMVWESDLRSWLKEWRDQGLIEWHGLAPRGRELMRGKDHSVALTADKLE